MPKVFGTGSLLLAVVGVFCACGESFSGGSGPTPDGGGGGGSAGRGGAGASGGGSTGGSSAGSSSGGRTGSGGSSGGRTGSGGSPGGSAGSGGSTGGSAGSGGSTGGGTAGSAGTGAADDGGLIDAGPIACSSVDQCPKPSSACRLAACLQNLCSTIPLASGVTPQQTRGDCLRLTCTPDGAEQTFADPTDVDDGNECTTDSCNGTAASHVPRTGMACANGFCDAQGRCTGCLDASHCGTAAPCMKYECVNGACQLGPAAAGTLCNNSADQCNGAGVCVDCVNSGGCGECCTCNSMNQCIPA
jgi:hypothetical protein